MTPLRLGLLGTFAFIPAAVAGCAMAVDDSSDMRRPGADVPQARDGSAQDGVAPADVPASRDVAPIPRADVAVDAPAPRADAGADASCVAPRQPCGSECVDVTTSATHCGVCGRACGMGQECRAGACASLPPVITSLLPATAEASRCSCFAYSIFGRNFQPGATVEFRCVSGTSCPGGGGPIVRMDPTQVTRRGDTELYVAVCDHTGEAGSYEFWVANPDMVHSAPASRFTLSASRPVLVSPVLGAAVVGREFCPSFSLERGGGVCRAAYWHFGPCGTSLPSTSGRLRLPPALLPAPGGLWSVTAAPPNCFTPPTAGAYCVWIENDDGYATLRTSVTVF